MSALDCVKCIKSGDSVIVLCDKSKGIALLKSDTIEDLTDKIDISRVSKLANEVTNRINILNLSPTVTL